MNNDPNLVNQTENNNPEIISNPVESLEPQIISDPVATAEVLSSSDEKTEILTEEASTSPNIRYNPVTGEELDVNEIIKGGDGKKKKAEVEYKPPSTFSTILLVLFFIFLLVFIIYLPQISLMVDNYNKKRNGLLDEKVEDIVTGKLVCTLEDNTVNLDRSFERVFQYKDKKLISAKFSTIVKGDANLDEEALQQLNEKCKLIKENVSSLSGIVVSCEYQSGKLIEKESFDYATYDANAVGSAYTEAGGSLLTFDSGADIDKVMLQMRQSGFTCDKEK